MPRRNKYYSSYSRMSKDENPFEKDVPVEEAGQAEEPTIEEEKPVAVFKEEEPEVKVVPESKKFNEKYAIVTNCSAVNVRSARNPESNILASISAGAKVTVIGEGDGYYDVDVNGVGKGFIKSEYLQFI